MYTEQFVAKLIDDQLEALWKQFESYYYQQDVIRHRNMYSKQPTYISNRYFYIPSDVQRDFKQTQQYKRMQYLIYMAPVLYENELLSLFQEVLDPSKVLRIPRPMVQTSTINF